MDFIQKKKQMKQMEGIRHVLYAQQVVFYQSFGVFLCIMTIPIKEKLIFTFLSLTHTH